MQVKAKLIDGKRMAEEIRAEVADGVAEMKERHGVVPGLAVLLVGDDPASAIYVRNKQRAATEVGMTAQDVNLPADVQQDALLEQVGVLNDDERVHGFLVQMPLPPHINKEAVLDSLDPLKDVDGLHPTNVGLLAAGRHRLRPRGESRGHLRPERHRRQAHGDAAHAAPAGSQRHRNGVPYQDKGPGDDDQAGRHSHRGHGAAAVHHRGHGEGGCAKKRTG